MLVISEVTVDRALDLSDLAVAWTILPTTEPLSGYTYDVLRYPTSDLVSDAPLDEATIVTTGIVGSTFEYLDTSVNLLDQFVPYYYRIRVNETSSGQSTISQAAGVVDEQPDNIAQYIASVTQTLLGIIGNPGFLVCRRLRTGQRCPDCWDPVKQLVTKSNCMTCYGTGWTGGYAHPIPIQASITGAQVTERFTPDIKDLVEQPVVFWTLNYPRLLPRDLVIDSQGRRYVVSNVQPTVRGRMVLRQIAQLERVAPTDIIYKVPTTEP